MIALSASSARRSVTAAICRAAPSASLHPLQSLGAAGRSRAAPSVEAPVLRRSPVTFRPASIPDGVTEQGYGTRLLL